MIESGLEALAHFTELKILMFLNLCNKEERREARVGMPRVHQVNLPPTAQRRHHFFDSALDARGQKRPAAAGATSATVVPS